MRVRMTPSERRAQLLAAAVDEARVTNYATITREAVARRCGCTAALVNLYFGGVEALKAAVLEHAVANEDLPIVAQGLVAGDPLAVAAPERVRREALAAVAP